MTFFKHNTRSNTFANKKWSNLIKLGLLLSILPQVSTFYFTTEEIQKHKTSTVYTSPYNTLKYEYSYNANNQSHSSVINYKINNDSHTLNKRIDVNDYILKNHVQSINIFSEGPLPENSFYNLVFNHARIYYNSDEKCKRDVKNGNFELVMNGVDYRNRRNNSDTVLQKIWSDCLNLVIFEGFGVKFSAKKPIFQNCLFRSVHII